MRRTPNRGANPCRETVKTMTKAHLNRCSWMGEKGSHAPAIAIPRTTQMLASFPAETSMLFEVVRRLLLVICVGGTLFSEDLVS